MTIQTPKSAGLEGKRIHTYDPYKHLPMVVDTEQTPEYSK